MFAGNFALETFPHPSMLVYSMEINVLAAGDMERMAKHLKQIATLFVNMMRFRYRVFLI